MNFLSNCKFPVVRIPHYVNLPNIVQNKTLSDE